MTVFHHFLPMFNKSIKASLQISRVSDKSPKSVDSSSCSPAWRLSKEGDRIEWGVLLCIESDTCTYPHPINSNHLLDFTLLARKVGLILTNCSTEWFVVMKDLETVAIIFEQSGVVPVHLNLVLAILFTGKVLVEQYKGIDNIFIIKNHVLLLQHLLLWLPATPGLLVTTPLFLLLLCLLLQQEERTSSSSRRGLLLLV
jgi:hypothetical protein